MLWIIPIGGRGSRTKELGEFKPFIEIKGQKMISWLLYSIKNNIAPKDKFIFTTMEYFEQKFNVRREIEKIFETHNLSNFFYLFSSKEVLPGVSSSIYMAKPVIYSEEPVTVMNCDQFTDFKMPENILPNTGYIALGLDFGCDKGFVEIKNGLITRFVEKEPISNFASTGTYIISSGKDFVHALEKQFEFDLRSCNGEYCTGVALNFLIDLGYKIYPLVPKAHYSLGSLNSIKYFASSPIAESLSRGDYISPQKLFKEN